MRQNRSLREISLISSKKYEPYNFIQPTSLNSLASPNSQTTLNIDNLIRKLKDTSYASSQEKDLKSAKNYQSAKNIEPKIGRIDLKSPTKNVSLLKTERTQKSKTKLINNENQEYLDYCSRKYSKNMIEKSVLTPVNRNVPQHCEPKKPKLLIRRQINFSEEFKLGKVLGKGRFGNVYCA